MLLLLPLTPFDRARRRHDLKRRWRRAGLVATRNDDVMLRTLLRSERVVAASIEREKNDDVDDELDTVDALITPDDDVTLGA